MSFRFDPTVSYGTLISTMAFLAAVFTAWSDAKQNIATNAMQVVHERELRQELAKRVDANAELVKIQRNELLVALEKLSTKIDDLSKSR